MFHQVLIADVQRIENVKSQRRFRCVYVLQQFERVSSLFIQCDDLAVQDTAFHSQPLNSGRE
jgi:hypothetical protein